MGSHEIEAMFLIVAFLVMLAGVFATSWQRDQKPVELFNEITNLVEYIGGPLDGQLGHPWDQADYMFRLSQCPDRARDGVGALYKNVKGTKNPVIYRFCGYGQKHSLEPELRVSDA